jgi:hypothetical protein
MLVWGCLGGTAYPSGSQLSCGLTVLELAAQGADGLLCVALAGACLIADVKDEGPVLGRRCSEEACIK